MADGQYGRISVALIGWLAEALGLSGTSRALVGGMGLNTMKPTLYIITKIIKIRL